MIQISVQCDAVLERLIANMLHFVVMHMLQRYSSDWLDCRNVSRKPMLAAVMSKTYLEIGNYLKSLLIA
jgi:hypothetical protein